MALPSTTVYGLLVTVGRSLVVVTVRVLAPAVPLVIPRRVICSWSFALTTALENRPQLMVSALDGLVQNPTSLALLTSRIVALSHVEVLVPAGSTTVSALPASLDR